MSFKAANTMTRTVICVQPDMFIYDAIRILVNRNITMLPVVDENLELLGILNENEALNVIYQSDESETQRVRDYMTTEFDCFDSNANIVDICDCLISNKHRAVPVREDGQFCGVISRTDLIRTILQMKHQELPA